MYVLFLRSDEQQSNLIFVSAFLKTMEVKPSPPTTAASLTLFLTCYNVNVAPKPQSFFEGAIASIRRQTEVVECQIRVDRLHQDKHDTYFTETVQSPNPAFALGIQLPLTDGRASLDANGRASPTADVLSFTLTRTQDNFTVGSATVSMDRLVTTLATTEHVPFELFGKVSKKSGGDPVLRITISSIVPTPHPFVRTQHPMLQSYMFAPASSSSDSRRKLVMEEVMEPEYHTSIPFLFLRCMHAELTQASELWNIRCLNERKKQLIFDSPEDALAAGCDVFEVTVRGAKNLKADNATGFSDSALMNPYVCVEFGETTARCSSSIDESSESSRCNTDVVCLGRTMTEIGTNDPNFSRQRAATLTGRSTSLPPPNMPRSISQDPSPPPPISPSSSSASMQAKSPSAASSPCSKPASSFTFFRKSNGPTTSSKGAFVFKVFHEVLHKKDAGQEDFAVGQCVVGWNISKPQCDETTQTTFFHFSIDQWVSIYPAMDRRSMYNDREDLGKLHVQIRIRCSTVKYALESESELRRVEKSPLYRLADLNKDHKLRKLIMAATRASSSSSSVSDSGRFRWAAETPPAIEDVKWHVDALKLYLQDVEDMLDYVNTARSQRTTFRPSVAKKDKMSQPLATNLHLGYFTTYDVSRAVDHVHVTVTCGAPTPHGLPDKRGLLDLEDSMMTNCNLVGVGFQTKQVYMYRKILCVSQSLSVLVTSFMAMLERCYVCDDVATLQQWATHGFLLQWESLVSSQGKEYTMLNDSWIAIKTLGRFALHVVAHPDFEGESMPTPMIHMETTEDQKGYVLHLPVPRAVFAMLPEVLRNGQHIAVVPVLFSQGINEMQTVANLIGSTDVDLQHNINKLCAKTVEMYAAAVLDATPQLPMYFVAHVNELLATLKSLVVDETRQTAKKNYRLLLVAADLTRQLRGGRVTFCKSGKDRTAMSVTLEQTRMVHNTSSEKVDMYDTIAPIADVMREYGVRIKVADKNVGRMRYTFNGLQRKMLPRVYRPPLKSIQGGADLS
ncbi:hypothetical protein DYB35_005543 [Aphanomyces astaci]|uniref:Uncharacterized protein n=1 Tax=Aphanomyces astaci TaxID=112090 RepID=A0A3R6Y059_APHAT|nr:hypothetical protein DYB35_005543 [Aphanomyces astaci]